MVTQKLMDIDIVIRRGVIYGLVTIAMVAILSIAVFSILNFRSLLNPPEIILITLVSGVIAAILFGPVKFAKCLVPSIAMISGINAYYRKRILRKPISDQTPFKKIF